MIQFTVNTNKGKLKLSSPTSWDEITVEQFLQIESSNRDIVEIFSILTGVDFEVLEDSKDKHLQDNLYQAVAFVFETPEWKDLPVPDKLMIGDKIIKIPKQIGDETLGQKIYFDQALAKSKGILDVITKIVAIYLEPQIHNHKFDRTKVEDAEKQIAKLPILQVYPIANFFLTKRRNLERFGVVGLHLIQKMKRFQNSQEEINSTSSKT